MDEKEGKLWRYDFNIQITNMTKQHMPCDRANLFHNTHYIPKILWYFIHTYLLLIKTCHNEKYRNVLQFVDCHCHKPSSLKIIITCSSITLLTENKHKSWLLTLYLGDKMTDRISTDSTWLVGFNLEVL